MPCYHPLSGWKAATVNPKTGKRGVVFNLKEGLKDLPVTVPCGACIGCRLDRAKQWAVRLMHEKQQHVHAWFVTLTYSDANLPPGFSLQPRDVQLFLKRLRKRVGNCRYLYCGEYGDTTLRPHYHMILFGPDFPDRKVIKRKENGDLYESPVLTEIWGLGHVWIGAVSFESCSYVARYITKKVTGDKAERHYEFTDPETGEVFKRLPEYIQMSRRPGIGKDWIDEYASETFHSDSVVVSGKEVKPPRYYDRHLESVDPQKLRGIKRKRIRRAAKQAANNTPERLQVRKEVKLAQIKNLKRDSI